MAANNSQNPVCPSYQKQIRECVNECLIKKAIEVFLPKVHVRSKRRDKKMMIRIPLFPGYLFVKTDLNHHEHIEIVKTAGAVRLIGSKDGRSCSAGDDRLTENHGGR
jgi:transcription antitermination factor NusG